MCVLPCFWRTGYGNPCLPRGSKQSSEDFWWRGWPCKKSSSSPYYYITLFTHLGPLLIQPNLIYFSCSRQDDMLDAKELTKLLNSGYFLCLSCIRDNDWPFMLCVKLAGPSTVICGFVILVTATRWGQSSIKCNVLKVAQTHRGHRSTQRLTAVW